MNRILTTRIVRAITVLCVAALAVLSLHITLRAEFGALLPPIVLGTTMLYLRFAPSRRGLDRRDKDC